MIAIAPNTIRTLVIAFMGGWVLRGALQWLRIHCHVRPCIFCRSRFVCPQNCASFDPHLGFGTCPNCGHERHLFVSRPQGPVQCWKCRLEPDPERGA